MPKYEEAWGAGGRESHESCFLWPDPAGVISCCLAGAGALRFAKADEKAGAKAGATRKGAMDSWLTMEAMDRIDLIEDACLRDSRDLDL